MGFILLIYFLSFLSCYHAQLSSVILPTPLVPTARHSTWLGQQGQQWQTLTQGVHNTIPAIPSNSGVNSGGQGNLLMTEPWAPGEARRVFSRNPEIWFNSCQTM